MKCPKCLKYNVEMVAGIVIKTSGNDGAIYVVPPLLANADTLELIECLKCPLCGYSDDGK